METPADRVVATTARRLREAVEELQELPHADGYRDYADDFQAALLELEVTIRRFILTWKL